MAKLPKCIKSFKLNRAGVREIMLSQEMAEICKEEAERIAQIAGDGYSVDTHVGRTRVNASVGAETTKAYWDNLRNNTLLKALGGGV